LLCVYDPLYANHLRGIPHPECTERVEAVAAALRRSGALNDLLPARDATDEEIERVHTPQYLQLVRDEIGAMRGHAGYLSTGDTVVDRGSLSVARRAAGGAIVAALEAFERKEAVFALVRPPGHHAEPDRGMGFCIFNNVAIAARAVQTRTGARTLIVDFDYHHGNGTQAVAGDGLAYLSTHAYPAYPGTGGPAENYVLTDRDVVVNLPLPSHGFGTEPFLAAWQVLLDRVVDYVRPNMLLVSAGFDYIAGDAVGDLGVDVCAASSLAGLLHGAARAYCDGRIAYTLEGGYGIAALTESIERIMKAHDADAAPNSIAEAAEVIPEPQRMLLGRIEAMLR